MANVDIEKELRGSVTRIIAEHKAEFDEVLRLAQEQAWDEGYEAHRTGRHFGNPYSKENI